MPRTQDDAAAAVTTVAAWQALGVEERFRLAVGSRVFNGNVRDLRRAQPPTAARRAEARLLKCWSWSTDRQWQIEQIWRDDLLERGHPGCSLQVA